MARISNHLNQIFHQYCLVPRYFLSPLDGYFNVNTKQSDSDMYFPASDHGTVFRFHPIRRLLGTLAAYYDVVRQHHITRRNDSRLHKDHRLYIRICARLKISRKSPISVCFVCFNMMLPNYQMTLSKYHHNYDAHQDTNMMLSRYSIFDRPGKNLPS